MIYGFYNERRRRIRVVPEQNEPIVININGENFIEIVYASDISVSGIGIVVPYGFEGCRIDKDVSIVVTLPIPEKRSLLCQGKIRHIRNSNFGVHFNGIEKEKRLLLRKYVSSQLDNQPWYIKYLFRMGII